MKKYPFYTLNVNVCSIFFFLVVWLILFKFFFTSLNHFHFHWLKKYSLKFVWVDPFFFPIHFIVCTDFCWRAFKMFFFLVFEEEKKQEIFFSNSTIGWLILGFGRRRRVEFFYFFFANSLKNKKQSFVYYIIIIICIRKNNNDSHHHHHFNFVARIFHLYTNTHTFVCDGFQFSSSSIMFPKYTILVHLEFFSLFLILFVVNYSIFFFANHPKLFHSFFISNTQILYWMNAKSMILFICKLCIQKQKKKILHADFFLSTFSSFLSKTILVIPFV